MSLFNVMYVLCRGRAVTNVGKTCGPTPCLMLAINTFKLSRSNRSIYNNKIDCSHINLHLIKSFLFSVLRSDQQFFSHFQSFLDGFLGFTSTKQWEFILARPGDKDIELPHLTL